MLGMIKMLPVLLIVAGAAYGYHEVTVSQKDTEIANLKASLTTVKNNQVKLEMALQTEQASRQRAEENLQVQLKAVGELTEKNTAMQAEMDDYLSIFKRHNLTKLARLRPGMIEPRINNGTAEVFRSIENDSKEIENADSQ
jgi:hypothetical protein